MARSGMSDEEREKYIQDIVDKAPPLAPWQRDRLVLLLNPATLDPPARKQPSAAERLVDEV